MSTSVGSYTVVPVEQEEMKERKHSDNNDDDLEEKFNKEFWLKVQEKVNNEQLSWSQATDEVRADRIILKHGKNALLVIIDEWPRKPKYVERQELIPSLEFLVSRLTEIILKRDTEGDYEYFRVPQTKDERRPTLLHLAAQQNFLHVCKCLVERYRGLLYLPTRNEPAHLPVELALKSYQDATAAYLISQMKNDRVHNLFLCKKDAKQSPMQFYFGDVISHRHPITKEPMMKKTVLAVLDKLINPRWPYLPERCDDEENDSEMERTLTNVPDDPMNYDFLYHILEADEHGRQPKIDVESEEHGQEVLNTISNSKFNHNSKSCLRRIAESGNKEAVQHPVVRMLVARKWNNFAHKWFCVQASFYVIFCLVSSFALIYGSTRSNPNNYENQADKLRLFCEIATIIFILLYFFEEVHEIIREGKAYFGVPYNYFDWLGIVLTFLVLPLRFAQVPSQWSIAALAFLVNVLKLFKFSCVTRTTGLYTKTLAMIIRRDIRRFMYVFIIIFIGFCGAVFMAFRATNTPGFYSDFSWLMLSGVRVLAEGQPVSEEYTSYGWLPIVLIVSYMGMVIVILLNILIAQLSYTYSEAKKTAKLHYAVDTMCIITRLENTKFAGRKLKVNNYLYSDWINEEDLAKEILEYTEERHPWETVEERITNVRAIMRKIVRRNRIEPETDDTNEKISRLMLMVDKMSKTK